MENEKPEQLLTREQVAERWQKSVKSVDRARQLNKNHLRAITIGGSIRFKLKDIQDFEKRFTNNSLLSLTFLDNDLEDLDPAAGLGKEPNYP